MQLIQLATTSSEEDEGPPETNELSRTNHWKPHRSEDNMMFDHRQVKNKNALDNAYGENIGCLISRQRGMVKGKTQHPSATMFIASHLRHAKDTHLSCHNSCH